MTQQLKICIVSSCGGHLTEVRLLRPAYEKFEHFYVFNDKALIPMDMAAKTKFISHSERDWKFLLNLWEAFCILRDERPTGSNRSFSNLDAASLASGLSRKLLRRELRDSPSLLQILLRFAGLSLAWLPYLVDWLGYGSEMEVVYRRSST